MEGVDIAGVVVAGQIVDALAHLVRGLVGKGNAKNIGSGEVKILHDGGNYELC